MTLAENIPYLSHDLTQECTHFPRADVPEGWYKANLYSKPTNIMCHNTTVSCLGGHTPKICAALSQPLTNDNLNISWRCRRMTGSTCISNPSPFFCQFH